MSGRSADRREQRPVHDRAAGRHRRRRRAGAAAASCRGARGGVAAHRAGGHVRARGGRHLHRRPRGARGSSGRCRGAATASASPTTCCCCAAASSGASSPSSRSPACRASRCIRVRSTGCCASRPARGHVVTGPVYAQVAAIDRDEALAPVRGRRARAPCAPPRAIARIAGRRMPMAAAELAAAAGRSLPDRSCRSRTRDRRTAVTEPSREARRTPRRRRHRRRAASDR